MSILGQHTQRYGQAATYAVKPVLVMLEPFVGSFPLADRAGDELSHAAPVLPA